MCGAERPWFCLRLWHLGHSAFLVLYPLQALLACNGVLASLLHRATTFQFETAALLSLTSLFVMLAGVPFHPRLILDVLVAFHLIRCVYFHVTCGKIA